MGKTITVLAVILKSRREARHASSGASAASASEAGTAPPSSPEAASPITPASARAPGTPQSAGSPLASAGKRLQRQLQSDLLDHVTPRGKRRRAESAVHAARAAGGAAQPSGATLIVVPGTLVDHWAHQIRQHTRPGVIRLHCISRAQDMLPAPELAAFDVVLTTFDVLSKQWSQVHGAAPAPAPARTQRPGVLVTFARCPSDAHLVCLTAPPPPPHPPSCTNWTRLVLLPVLSGQVSSL